MFKKVVLYIPPSPPPLSYLDLFWKCLLNLFIKIKYIVIYHGKNNGSNSHDCEQRLR